MNRNKTWDIERWWQCRNEDGSTRSVATTDLNQFKACCLLGAGGMGKTVELERIASGFPGVHVHRLADEGASSSELARSLKDISDAAQSGETILLDSLDEALIPVRNAGTAITKWLRKENLAGRGIKLCISCRPGVWPSFVEDAIRSQYDADQTVIATLLPLDSAAVETVLESEAIERAAFHQAITKSGSGALAECPLTLRMLIRIFKSDDDLPQRKTDVFKKAVRLMVMEDDDRRERGHVPTIAFDQIRGCGEAIACCLLVSGLRAVTLSSEPVSGMLDWEDVDSDNMRTIGVDQESLNALSGSALSISDQPKTFRFVHQQIAEFLAACRIAKLPLHQIKSLLATEEQGVLVVRGTLLEVAAFTASLNSDFQVWLSDNDPVLVAHSDVANAELKRIVVHGLADRFKTRLLTDAQLYHSEIRLETLEYPNSELDIRQWLSCRDQSDADLISFAVRCVEDWNLEQLEEELVDLAIDENAPYDCRRSALHALRMLGRPDAKRRLRSLWSGNWTTSQESVNLVGLALQICWRDTLTVEETLAHVQTIKGIPKTQDYDRFIYDLETSRFDAAEDLLAGLEWVTDNVVENGAVDHQRCIAHWICQEACKHIREEPVEAALVQSLLSAAQNHFISLLDKPLSLDARHEDEWLDPIEAMTTEERRRLVRLLVEQATSSHQSQFATRSLLRIDDFDWLIAESEIEEATDPAAHWIRLANALPWQDSAACVNSWIEALNRGNEAVIQVLGQTTCTVLDGDEAAALREQYRRQQDLALPTSVAVPTYEAELADALAACKVDPLNWPGVFRYASGSVGHQEYASYLHLNEGWKSASGSTRAEIVEAAKAYCDVLDIDGLYKGIHPTSFCSAPFGAISIVAHRDPSWLTKRDEDWWMQWLPSMLYDLSFGHPFEDTDLRDEIYRLVENHAEGALVKTACRLATETSSRDWRIELSLPFLRSNAAKQTAVALIEVSRLLQSNRACSVIEFILNHAPDASPKIGDDFEHFASINVEGVCANAVEFAVALLLRDPTAFFERVLPILATDDRLARAVIRQYIHKSRYVGSGYRYEKDFGSVSAESIGRFASMLFRLYPDDVEPTEDPTWHQQEEIRFRDSLIDSLRSRADAVTELRRLETEHNSRAPWIRRVRAMAEQSLRSSVGDPLPVQSVLAMLSSHDKRLLSSPDDVLAAIATAFDKYSREIQSSSPSPVLRLWNTPHGEASSTKLEEEVSDELLVVIREYFEEYAVVAGREVQIRRRNLGSELPGSRLDVKIEVPATVSQGGNLIEMPVEVKLSHNSEVKTGMKDQLIDRYMKQIGVNHGIYVLVWMQAPNLAAKHKPVWKSIDVARAELEQQAQDAAVSGKTIKVVIVDATLT